MDKEPIAILTADWHLRDTTPVCRTDDFEAAQWRKVDWVFDLAQEHGCPIFIAGDVFHKWKSSPYLLNMAISRFRPAVKVQFISGNHDLPGHLPENYNKSALSVLNCSHFPFTQKLGDMEGSTLFKGLKIKFLHELVWMNDPPFPGAPEEGNAVNVLARYPDHDIVLTGDNHKPFVYREGKRVLVNPGPLMRQTAGEVCYKPRVYFLYQDCDVEKCFIPIEEDVVSRAHIEKKEKHEMRVDAFVERLSGDVELDLSFETNLKNTMASTGVSKEVEVVVQEALDG